jgi:hypothetical protein
VALVIRAAGRVPENSIKFAVGVMLAVQDVLGGRRGFGVDFEKVMIHC